MVTTAEVSRTRRIYRTAYFAVLPTIALIIVSCMLAPSQFHPLLMSSALALTLLCLTLSLSATNKFKAHESERAASDEKIRTSKVQMEELFAMTDMLQSADGHEDAACVLEATTRKLLPAFGGGLYVFNNSRDRLDLIRSWNEPDGFSPAETLLPSSCWAIKRGKAHYNDRSAHGLCCMHHHGDFPTLEMPMMARGSLFGLLVLASDGGFEPGRLDDAQRIARALADSMSLALSNIALNEKLKTQSMRDPLTGLYNRRYMEDALERAIASAARDGTSTSVIMIDLDNFKKLNDEHGHAKGDAVLRDVAAHLVGSLRPSDTVSRYGGEELLLILPNTRIEDAARKAEALRCGIEQLSDAHGLSISASFGVAAHPSPVAEGKELIKAADAALYDAKRDGKNCVRSPAGRNTSSFQPKLVIQD